MYCRNCGFELKENDRKCPGCGSPVVPLSKDALPKDRVTTWVQKEADDISFEERPASGSGTSGNTSFKETVYVYENGKEYKGEGFNDVNIPMDKYEQKEEAKKQAANTAYASSTDTGSFGWGLLGCCVPLVGLILFLVWKDTKPLSARKAGIGAIVGVAIYVIMMVISTILGVGASMYYWGFY